MKHKQKEGKQKREREDATQNVIGVQKGRNRKEATYRTEYNGLELFNA